MGVSVANLPLSVSDDNINLGDKDSVRRRALWVLEGKPGLNAFSKVEIPDISTPELPKFEFCACNFVIIESTLLLTTCHSRQVFLPCHRVHIWKHGRKTRFVRKAPFRYDLFEGATSHAR